MKMIGCIIIWIVSFTMPAGGEETIQSLPGQWYVQPYLLFSSRDEGIHQDSIADMLGFPLVWEFLPNGVLNVTTVVDCGASCSLEKKNGTWEPGGADNTFFFTDIERVRWKASRHTMDKDKYLLVMHKASEGDIPPSVSVWTVERYRDTTDASDDLGFD